MFIVRTTKDLRVISGLLHDSATALWRKSQNNDDPLSEGYRMLSEDRMALAQRMELVLREAERAEALEKRATAALDDPQIEILTKVEV